MITTAARQVGSAVKTIASDDVPDAVFNSRMETCRACDRHSKKIREIYCDECKCPRRYWARLSYKNRKVGHRCPLKKF